MAEPVKGVAYDFPISLGDSSDPTEFKSSPTLAAGDFQISKDGGSFANLATLPVVTPSSSISVNIALSATEMNADKVYIKAIDAAGSEWESLTMFIDVPESTSETAVNLLEGDYVETNLTRVINKRGTTTELLSKTITGSLLVDGVVIQTFDA